MLLTEGFLGWEERVLSMGGGMGFEFVRVGEREGRRDGWRDGY
jgi:hypothetical protein